MMLRKRIKQYLLLFAIFTISGSLFTQASFAAGTPGFEAGRIIDDAVMTSYGSMSVSQIQTFLNSKVTSCDTNGQKLSEYGGPDLNGDGKVQRWEWGKSRYNQTKFICLKDYKASDGRTASRVIYDIGRKYKINPQVLIVLLQKEQGLVTDSWPLNIQYRTATGYGCPDTAPCDSQYYGLVNQLDWAAKMFRSIIDQSPDWYSPYVAGYNPQVYWHPDTSRCGSRPLTIENWSTAALYSYTPYRPNQAALDAGYGTGNSCSAYGNRNFYLYFKDWFGNPKQADISVGYLNIPQQVTPNETAYAYFWIRNNTKSTINLGTVKIIGRSSTNENYDFPGVSNLTIAPGATYSYKQARMFDNEGTYSFRIGRYANNQWQSPPFESLGIDTDPSRSTTVINKPSLTSSSSLTPTTAHVGQQVNGGFTVRNNSALYDLNLGRMKFAVRKDGKGYDFPSSGDILLSPGSSYTYNQPSTFSEKGTYSYWIANHRDDAGWSKTYPSSTSSAIVRSGKITVKDSVTTTQSLQLNPTASSVHAGQTTTATFKVRNFSTSPVDIGSIKVAVRDSQGRNYDFPSSGDVTLNPGQEYSYSQARTFPKAGKYTFWIANYRTQHGWSNDYPEGETGGEIRRLQSTIKDSVTLTESLVASPNTVTAGQTTTATFKVRNFSTSPVDIGSIKVAVRDSQGRNYDFPSSGDVTLNPGQEYSYSQARTFPKAGKYTFWIANYRTQHGWSNDYPEGETDSMSRTISFSVR